MVQWLRLHALNAGGTGSIPGRGRFSMLNGVAKKPQKSAVKLTSEEHEASARSRDGSEAENLPDRGKNQCTCPMVRKNMAARRS